MKQYTKIGPWSVVDQRLAYENPWIKVEHHEVITPAGGRGVYGTVRFRNLALGIVPVDAEGHTYLVGQHRFPLDRYSWEIPEGGGAPEIEPLESAARELEEETGLRAGRWQELLQADLSNSVSDERAIAYLAWDLTHGAPRPDPTEQLTVKRLPLSEAFAMVASGGIRDAISIMSLQAVQILQSSGRLPSPFA